MHSRIWESVGDAREMGRFHTVCVMCCVPVRVSQWALRRSV